MQKLKNTFRFRSYSPPNVEMKSQDSLEVPKQVRSASFDDIEYRRKNKGSTENFLKVPGVRNQRSKSFDSSSTYPKDSDNLLDVPKLKARRRASGSDKGSTAACVHCALWEEYLKDCEENSEGFFRPSRLSYSSSESLSPGNSSDDEEPETEVLLQRPSILLEDPGPFVGAEHKLGGITVILSPNSPCSEQHPFFPNITGNITICDSPDSPPSVGDSSEEGGLPFLSLPSADQDDDLKGHDRDSPPLAGETVLSLKVPVLPKQQRSASVDSSFMKVNHHHLDGTSDEATNFLDVPKAQRSRSVDIVLPTDEVDAYRAFPRPSQSLAKPIPAPDVQTFSETSEQRNIRREPDWSEHAVNGDHLWISTSASGDLCLGEPSNCSKQGQRVKCAACKLILHRECVSLAADRIGMGTPSPNQCKPTFHDVGIRQYREQTKMEHHWVHRKNQKGKCKRCYKSFQSKLSFSSSKEIVAVICTWCKTAYHNKEPCFTKECYKEGCSMGIHADIIIPPSWIIKLPRKGSFKSSIRKSPKKRSASKKKPKKEDNQRTFVIKPIPSASNKPVLVFINPKSGGNQGAKLMQKFQWLLNPRQVFDLSQGGPNAGLELYKKVPNLRVLACGGDGTAGWVLSVLDAIGIFPAPPIAVLPLGTGNDLARALGWGGGYTDEPISKILTNVAEGEITQLDRWDLRVEKHPYPDPTNHEEGKSKLPLDVVNNYFSLGADAYIALEFHEAREAHPEKFNSRLKNKMFYGQAGGKDLLQRKWKDLSGYVTLECDGKDLTPKLKELKVHAILFLNIPSYGGGTHPWNPQSSGFDPQRTHDGLIEVIGLTTYQLAILQAGGHGTCLAQCRHAKLATTRTIPMQVDGEPCKLAPSVIELQLRNRVNMVAKSKRHGGYNNPSASFEKLKFNVVRISMGDYLNYHYNKEKLLDCSKHVCYLTVPQNADLEYVRSLINTNIESSGSSADSGNEGVLSKQSSEWCFLDSITADRCFRIDKAQENLHYITDISTDDLFILDPEVGVGSNTNSPESQDTESLNKEQDNAPLSVDVQPENGTGETFNTNVELSRQKAVPKRNGENKKNVQSPTFSDTPKAFRPKTPVCRTTMLKSLHDASIHVKELGPGIYDPSHLLEKNSEEIIKAAKLADLDKLKDSHNKGFSLLSIDQYGMTALHHAAQYGHKEIVSYLIASATTSILNVRDNETGQTALHKAASYKRRTICCMLVNAGASLTLTDYQGMTPRQYAMRAQDEELAEYLASQELHMVIAKNQETTV